MNEYGIVEPVPAGWVLLPPGDAALSRRIKLDGPTLTVIEMKGRKRMSRGIWAPAERIEALRQQLLQERSHPAYLRKLEAGRLRRAAAEERYTGDFAAAVVQFLNFHPMHRAVASVLGAHVAADSTPVGSGTVARTRRIPIEERASNATLAWLRHQTTDYDRMNIPHASGRRREIRRLLAQRSIQLLGKYRTGARIDFARCPLYRRIADEANCAV